MSARMPPKESAREKQLREENLNMLKNIDLNGKLLIFCQSTMTMHM